MCPPWPLHLALVTCERDAAHTTLNDFNDLAASIIRNMLTVPRVQRASGSHCAQRTRREGEAPGVGGRVQIALETPRRTARPQYSVKIHKNCTKCTDCTKRTDCTECKSRAIHSVNPYLSQCADFTECTIRTMRATQYTGWPLNPTWGLTCGKRGGNGDVPLCGMVGRI